MRASLVIGAIVFATIAALTAAFAAGTYPLPLPSTDGTHTVRLAELNQTVTVTVRKGETIACFVMKDGRRYDFKKAPDQGSSAGNTNCSCGNVCWEDEKLLQSICVCRACGGGYSGRDPFLVDKSSSR